MPNQGYNMHHQQQGQNNGNWWNLESDEDREAYLKWCEERKIQMQEQEESQQLLRELQHRAEEKKREMHREQMMKEAKAKRESMVAQWRMWQSQIKMAEEYTGNFQKYEAMNIKLFFYGIVPSPCDAVKAYVKQLQTWETQYNF